MDDYQRNKTIVEERRALQNQNRNRAAHNDLQDKITKSINTTMVGSLKDIEDYFGHLWGHNTDNPTQKQLEMEELWQDLRQSILDRGNAALEKAKYHLNRFDVNTKDNQKHKYNLHYHKD